jgi:hypothetical protein
VRVELPASTSLSGFIPRPTTGFQVKVSDMPHSAILVEMRPGGTVRPAIQELVSASGAYIIVSAKGSTTDSALQRRRRAMREAMADFSGSDALAVDFYDRERVAGWVRDHPGLVFWVREKIGQPIRGWRPYASWAAPMESLEAEYLADSKSRLQDWQSPREGPLPVIEGINRIRRVLAVPKGAVRLIGLSGMGKTRLAQALFDDRVGDQSLDPALAVYTNLADQPEPSPRHLARRLVQNAHRAIVVVDNCPPETHRALVEIGTEGNSALSLITIEYDIRDDDPEGTEVFHLEPGSDEVIERLLQRHAPETAEVDRRHIAEFSGGNARIALALAHTVRRGESVANLTNKELFERLFHQRRPQDEGLLKAAEVCSLVYSFNGEALEGEAAELPFLAGIAGLTSDQLYRCVGELRERGLIQCRSSWRAVLPQALANRLARQALERMPPEKAASSFLNQGSERLLRSFSRRLGYLHDCESAQRIVRGWLSDGGILANVNELNSLGQAMFQNVAPVAPDAALEAIERAASDGKGSNLFSGSSSGHNTLIPLLKSLAYDPSLFQRASLLLARLVIVEPRDRNYNSARDPFLSLFQLYLSGTHASIGQRLQVIDTLIRTDEASNQACAVDALNRLLEAWHFSSSSRFDFGARPRDYGWHPTSRDDIVAWYRASIDYATHLGLSNAPLSEKARSILANNFRGLWTKAGVFDELESMARELTGKGFWIEGWVAVCYTIRFHIKEVPSDIADRLRVLEKNLRPSDLLQTARAYIFTKAWESVGVGGGEPEGECGDTGSAYERANKTTERLGCEIATKSDILDLLLPDLVKGDVGRRMQFGRGLAAGTEQLDDMWKWLGEALAAVPEVSRNIDVLRGFLQAAMARDAKKAAAFLDAAIEDPILGPWFPLLQTSVEIDERGAERIEAAVQIGLAPSWTYKSLSLGRATDPIPAKILHRLVLGIANLPGGFDIAVDILGMRIFSAHKSGTSIDDELIECGRELICRYDFDRPGQMADYQLGEIIIACFSGTEAVEHASMVCRKLKAGFSSYRVHPFHFRHLLESLFRTQPMIALDEFLGDQAENTRHTIAREFDFDHGNPLELVPMETLIAWAQINPLIRFPRLASAIIPFRESDDKTGFVWTPLALQVLNLAPDRISVLRVFSFHFWPGHWSGSLADILERRRALPCAFLSDVDPNVVAWAREADAKLSMAAERERQNERRRDESFE